jgi:hypothetical protein
MSILIMSNHPQKPRIIQLFKGYLLKKLVIEVQLNIRLKQRRMSSLSNLLGKTILLGKLREIKVQKQRIPSKKTVEAADLAHENDALIEEAGL